MTIWFFIVEFCFFSFGFESCFSFHFCIVVGPTHSLCAFSIPFCLLSHQEQAHAFSNDKIKETKKRAERMAKKWKKDEKKKRRKIVYKKKTYGNFVQPEFYTRQICV